MAFTNLNERDLNSFLLGRQQTSEFLGPGAYMPKSDFGELKKRTHSRKPPAFLQGMPPGKESVAIGQNFYNQSYTPGPGKYSVDQSISTFETVTLKDNLNNSNYFTVNQGGKLQKKT